jgi:hypothetical protein
MTCFEIGQQARGAERQLHLGETRRGGDAIGNPGGPDRLDDLPHVWYLLEARAKRSGNPRFQRSTKSASKSTPEAMTSS